jgi:WhiB family transcriptional regulator, redox-sensing transcriptional regulator
VEDKSQARCLGLSELFYGPIDDGRKEKNRQVREAKCKILCFKCPLRTVCLMTAMRERQFFGIWGGMSEGERKRFHSFLKRLPPQTRTDQHLFKNAVQRFYEEEEADYEEVAG